MTKKTLKAWRKSGRVRVHRLQEPYQTYEEFSDYDQTYGLAARLGYDTAKTAWHDNPMVCSGVNPEDFCLCPLKPKVVDWPRQVGSVVGFKNDPFKNIWLGYDQVRESFYLPWVNDHHKAVYVKFKTTVLRGRLGSYSVRDLYSDDWFRMLEVAEDMRRGIYIKETI